jgi:hypothetical protein
MPNLFKPIAAVFCLVFALFLGAPNALADSIVTFNVAAVDLGGYPVIGGTLTVDVTNGTVTAVDLTAKGYADFTIIYSSTPGGCIFGLTLCGTS